MKKRMLILLAAILVCLSLTLLPPRFTRNRTSTGAMLVDLINPFVQESFLYVETSATYQTSFQDATDSRQTNYEYETTGFDRRGQARKIKYTSFGRELTAQRYLKLTIKGQSVRYFEEVPVADLPPQALAQLK